MGGHAVDLLAVELDRPGGRHHAENRLQGGGLADPVAAEQRGHPALGDRKVDALQDV